MNKYKILDRFHSWLKEIWICSDSPSFGETEEERLQGFIGWVNQHGGYHSEVILDGDTDYENKVMEIIVKRRKDFSKKEIICTCAGKLVPATVNRGAVDDERIPYYAEYKKLIQGE